MALLAGGFVEDVTTMLRSVGRSVEMQADGGFGHAWILNPMQAQAIAHVRYLIWLIRGAASDLKSCRFKGAAERLLADVTYVTNWMLMPTLKSMCGRCLDIAQLEMSRHLLRCRRAGMARQAFRRT